MNATDLTEEEARALRHSGSEYEALLDRHAPAKWRCALCGCLWRLNPAWGAPYKPPLLGRRSWSLWDATQKSCEVCEVSVSSIEPALASFTPNDAASRPLTIREQFAIAAMQGLLACPTFDFDPVTVAEKAVAFGDCLREELAR